MLATKKVITTHSGSFHADESLAVYMLQQLPEYKDADVVRSRDPAVIAKADIVVDVGGEYVPEKLRFDHHQRGFKETFGPNYDILLSSAGLVYKHFGRRVVAQILGWQESDPKLDVVYQKIYDDFVLAFDGIDNGVSQYDAAQKPKYRDPTNASSRVGKLNPWWNEENVDYQERFMKAVAMVGAEFHDRVRYTALAWLPGRELVVRALEARTQYDPNGHIMVLDRFCPWKEHLHILEEEQKIDDAKKPLYVLYEDDTAKQWRIQAVSVTPESFQSRKPLPEPWRGIRDQALSDMTGIPGGVFVHASGFIGGNQTKEGAMKMAQKALTM
ncbi:metal-dependent protein hydrolase [Powellomyces hirtus]|nr:metal-dependent protein hydrolase [Powellomyces hirtus]